jgi:hypothetical protein
VNKVVASFMASLALVATVVVMSQETLPQVAIATESTSTIETTIAAPVYHKAPALKKGMKYPTARRILRNKSFVVKRRVVASLEYKGWKVIKWRASVAATNGVYPEGTTFTVTVGSKKLYDKARAARIKKSMKHGRWVKSHKAWDKLARRELRRGGCSPAEVRMAMDIHHHEGEPNSVSASGSYHGGWQISPGMAHGHPWWNPEWSTARALRYMRGRYGSVAGAYNFRNSHNWY